MKANSTKINNIPLKVWDSSSQNWILTTFRLHNLLGKRILKLLQKELPHKIWSSSIRFDKQNLIEIYTRENENKYTKYRRYVIKEISDYQYAVYEDLEYNYDTDHVMNLTQIGSIPTYKIVISYIRVKSIKILDKLYRLKYQHNSSMQLNQMIGIEANRSILSGLKVK